MEWKEQLIIFFILAVVIFSICTIVYKAKQKEYITYFEYTSPDGEEFTIDNRSIGDVHQYYVHAFVQNTEYIIPLRSAPGDVEDIPLDDNVMRVVYRPGGVEQLYMTQDVNLADVTNQRSFMGIVDVGKILGTNEFGIYKIPSRTAFTSKVDDVIPVKTCADVSDTEAVIYLRLGEANRVFIENECVIIEGVDGEGLLLAADRFAYHLLGVI